jgi:hypothetical protein
MKDIQIETLFLKGGAEVTVDLSASSKCRSCGTKIWFAVTKKNNKYIPISETIDGEYQAHFADCKQAGEWRKPTMSNKIREEESNQQYLNEL